MIPSDTRSASSVDGVNPFQVVQATWNLLEVSAGDALAEARAQGWGVIVKEVARQRPAHRPVTAKKTALKLVVRRRREDVSLTALAMATALAQPWADVVLSGAVTAEQLAENLAAQHLEPVAHGGLKALAVPPLEYWAQRGRLEWR